MKVDTVKINELDVDDVLAKLEAAKRTAKGWMARCPSHNDRNPSLSIATDGGKVLLHCHAGCSFENIVHALRLNEREQYEQRKPKETQKQIVAAYDYTDSEGNVV